MSSVPAAEFTMSNSYRNALLSSAADVDGNDHGARWCEDTQPYGDGDLGTPGAANPPC